MTTVYPATLLCDFYKVSHRAQYPPGTEFVYSTWIPRESKIEGIDEVVAFGFQGFIEEYLNEYFAEHFFQRPEAVVVHEYWRFIKATLGEAKPDVSHIRALHQLGYLPLRIKAVPEGTAVPLRVPMLTIENTHPDFFWLTNYIETLFSCEVWLPCTSATIAKAYRTMLDAYAEETGDPSFVQFQGHDFSMRGMTSLGSAAKSGAGHLLSFVGTDTIPAIAYAEEFYGANIDHELIGTSIPATEHSVMCAYGQDELESFRHILTTVYPSGMCSVVSDTWDLWQVLTKVLPALKAEIMAREGKLVIRPDSGDPVDIICGTWQSFDGLPGARHEPHEFGVVELLWKEFGGTVNEKGYKVLDPHVGTIYGDSITLERAKAICERLKAKGYASTNVVYGIGSYTYQHVTRDTFGFALKSTWAQINGQEVAIFKDPVTDTNHMKKSLTGRVAVMAYETRPGMRVVDGLDKELEESIIGPNLLRTIFEDGRMVVIDDFTSIRERVSGR